MTAPNGNIDAVRALNGTIGSASFTAYIGAKNNIQIIEARQIWANIDARMNGGNPGDSQVWRVSASHGDLTGSITARWIYGGAVTITPGIHVPNGNLNADISLTDALRNPISVGGSLMAGRAITMERNIGDNGTMSFGSIAGRVEIKQSLGRPITVTGALTGSIVVGESIPSPHSITAGSLGAGGLVGQIIVNAKNTTGVWTGPVTVGGVGLLPRPYYANLSSTLGGGAVGLVPYGLHKEDCSPPHAPDGGCGLQYSMRTWPASLDGGSRQTIVLRHYGPVSNDSGLSPCLLERLAITCPYPIACPGPWEEVLSTTLPIEPAYQVYLPPEYPREVWVALKMNNGQPAKFQPNYTYRVSLISDGGVTRLRSAGTLASTAPGIVGYPYEYKPLCADVNLDSLINPGDIDAWMEQPADVDSSGEINLDDLVRLIEVVGT
ncbi:MAG: hypothetical protein IPM33_04945 [Phycisphaerales bacterium]|nr:hypothetical protein [Phycisphaerales bacterium]